MSHRAFISSTFEDLARHRAWVIRSLRSAGITVDPMEDWTSAADVPKNLSTARVKGCDLCVLLVAFRRGHIPSGEKLSITQMEYQAALDSGIDLLVFMLHEDAPWPRKFDELDRDPEMRPWRQQLLERHGVSFFKEDPSSIDIAPALTRWISERSAPRQQRHLDTVALPRQLEEAGRLIERGAIRDGLLEMRRQIAAILSRHLSGSSDVEPSAPMDQLRSLEGDLPEASFCALELALSTAAVAHANGAVSVDDAVRAVEAAAEGLRLLDSPRIQIRAGNGKYSFALVTSTNEIVLTSEQYHSRASLAHCLKAAQHLITDERRISRRTAPNGVPYFEVVGANGERLATSTSFDSARKMEAAIQFAKNALPTAPVLEGAR